MKKILSSKKTSSPEKLSYSFFSYCFWLFAMIISITSISTAMFIQYVVGDLPCPLCLLQRAAFFGFAYGAILYFKGNSRFRYIGISLLFLIILQVISTRQALIDIYPRPGHEWIGSAIFGIHLPVWSFIGSVLILLTIAFDFIFITKEGVLNIRHFPKLKMATNIVTIILILLCAVNLVSVILQCGLGICHTFGYELLK